ncbi:hypothetical protein I553_8616 [Mycobacterium xenopi 4042]|uniref:Uncharacterized protein n=1 Tax=Mycobacterium xenopi 4042 TaxID=1299334 RepID=X8CM84_MYCXE|nr:hypothetical protein I553_8616 [Mycobacterium xenopi 4042]
MIPASAYLMKSRRSRCPTTSRASGSRSSSRASPRECN